MTRLLSADWMMSYAGAALWLYGAVLVGKAATRGATFQAIAWCGAGEFLWAFACWRAGAWMWAAVFLFMAVGHGFAWWGPGGGSDLFKRKGKQ